MGQKDQVLERGRDPPLVILVGGVALSLSKVSGSARDEAAEGTEPVGGSQPDLLPNLKDLKIELNHDIDVVEVRVERTGGVHMVGTVKNKTDKAHRIRRHWVAT